MLARVKEAREAEAAADCRDLTYLNAPALENTRSNSHLLMSYICKNSLPIVFDADLGPPIPAGAFA
jgi:hypothetical protein